MSTIINTDLGKNLDWRAYRHGYNEIKWAFKQDGSALDITDRTYSMIFRDPGSSAIRLELKEGEGLVNGGASGVLTTVLVESDIEQKLKRDMYFFELRYTLDSKPFRAAQGYINLQSDKNKTEFLQEIPIPTTDMTGQTVNMNVFAFGSIIDLSTLDPSDIQNLFDMLIANMTTQQKQVLWDELAKTQLSSQP